MTCGCLAVAEAAAGIRCASNRRVSADSTRNQNNAQMPKIKRS